MSEFMEWFTTAPGAQQVITVATGIGVLVCIVLLIRFAVIVERDRRA